MCPCLLLVLQLLNQVPPLAAQSAGIPAVVVEQTRFTTSCRLRVEGNQPKKSPQQTALECS
jgi:hypothetical protein